MPADLAVRSERAVTPEGVRAATIVASGGRIVAVAGPEDRVEARRTIDAGSLVVMPGVVDTHVHVNEPGRTDWEGFETATRAAAAGGVTTLVDMPLNSVPPTTTVAHLRDKRAAAAGRCRVDVGFWGGIVAGTSGHIDAMLDAGVLGFKCFLVPSGVDEFPPVSAADLRAALPRLASRDAVLLVHAEDPGIVEQASGTGSAGDRRSYETYLRTRPEAAEAAAVALATRLAGEAGARVHIVHLSSAAGLAAVADARRLGVRVTAETCPHYLHFCAETVPAGATEFKCAPPIRGRAARDALWQGLRDGEIDLVASDHSPSPPGMKCRESGDFLGAWGGIASLQLALPVVWTGAKSRGLGLADLAQWLCDAPARLAGLGDRKGRLAPGFDADLVVWDPDRTVTVDAERLCMRHRLTPYLGETVQGAVEMTILRGMVVFPFEDGPADPSGELIESTRARTH